MHALFRLQIRNAYDISAAIQLAKGWEHEGLPDFPVHHGTFIQMMHQNKFRREFIIFIACSIGFRPGLAEIQIRLGRFGEIISHLSEQGVYISIIEFSSLFAARFILHIPLEFISEHERALVEIPTILEVDPYGLIQITGLIMRNDRWIKVLRFFCIIDLGVSIFRFLIASVIKGIDREIIFRIMKSRQIFFCTMYDVFIFLPPIGRIVNAGVLVHIVVAVSSIGMGDIQVIIEIVAGIEIRMLPAFDIVIQASFRHPASFRFCGGRRNIVDLPRMIICSSESQLPCLEGSGIILDAIIAKSGLDRIRTLALGNDIDDAAICLRAV